MKNMQRINRICSRMAALTSTSIMSEHDYSELKSLKQLFDGLYNVITREVNDDTVTIDMEVEQCLN